MHLVRFGSVADVAALHQVAPQSATSRHKSGLQPLSGRRPASDRPGWRRGLTHVHASFAVPESELTTTQGPNRRSRYRGPVIAAPVVRTVMAIIVTILSSVRRGRVRGSDWVTDSGRTHHDSDKADQSEVRKLFQCRRSRLMVNLAGDRGGFARVPDALHMHRGSMLSGRARDPSRNLMLQLVLRPYG